ncbi:MAG: DegT/DnrJ/EryC1/StrS family aminotransferase [Bacteroidetes bacterium]|nr:DegT/DnrJ/EryC1/StrS family aminotransferase [Bacteroidota bacterium]
MINVTKTYLPDKDKYKFYVDKIFDSGWLTNNGQLVQLLEKRLSEYLGVKNLILVANGTLALQVAYKLLNLKGDIVTTPFSFVATTSSMVWEGLNPVFSDINSNTFNVEETILENTITEKTSAIVPVHVFGNICNIEAIQKAANKYNLKVIYDAAHAFGVKYKNKSIANYGDVVTFSFHSTKIFHTIEGGAIIIKDDSLFDKAKLMINFGIPGYDKISELGINCKMNEFQAAMGLCVLDDIEMILRNREKVYKRYFEAFNKNEKIKLQKLNTEATQNFSYFPIVFESEEILLKVVANLKLKEIYPRRYFYPSLESLPYIKKKFNMPVSTSISKRILCLPLYDSLKESEHDSIIKILNQSL